MFESLQRSINKLESSLMSKREDSKTHTHTKELDKRFWWVDECRFGGGGGRVVRF